VDCIRSHAVVSNSGSRLIDSTEVVASGFFLYLLSYYLTGEAKFQGGIVARGVPFKR
jgi:hypothetical protein